MKHFKTILEFTEFAGLPSPEHPLINIYSTGDYRIKINPKEYEEDISGEFYSISCKRLIDEGFGYGRTNYDCTNGTMFFTAPNQIIKWKGIHSKTKGFTLFIHPDFINHHHLGSQLKTYSFFQYSVNEALHLTPKEESIIHAIFENIIEEYRANHDGFSKEIILAHIDTLLNYSNRFYNRQFIHRRDLILDMVSQVNIRLDEYYDQNLHLENNLPNKQWLSDELNLTPRYLSDALKSQTGLSTVEHIHNYLIGKAKNLLLQPNITISEIAYQLGFEYPQYFSRLFKKKVGLSPQSYIRRESMN